MFFAESVYSGGEKQHRDRHQKPGADIRVVFPLSVVAEIYERQDVQIEFKSGASQGELFLRLNPNDDVDMLGSQTQWRFDLSRDEVVINLSFMSTKNTIEQLSFYAEIEDQNGLQSRVLSIAILPPAAISQPISLQKSKASGGVITFSADEKIYVPDP